MKTPTGMPSIFVHKNSGKSFLFVVNKYVTQTNKTNIAFLAFIGMFYMLDVEYPSCHVIALSIFHRICHFDNRVIETEKETFSVAWEEVKIYLPACCIP